MRHNLTQDATDLNVKFNKTSAKPQCDRKVKPKLLMFTQVSK